MKPVQIVHLYAKEMNIYGDRGNILTLVRRLDWRGFAAEVTEVGVGDQFDLNAADLIFAGGGQDRGQIAVGRDLQTRSADIHRLADAGLPMLLICGTYQLFGREFVTTEGETIPGIGIFNARTIGSAKRMIGNVIIESRFGRLVGFENHSGQTELETGQEPLGRVKQGYGNNDRSGYEGAIYKNVIGTYLHGPVLPKNPKLADHLLLQALSRQGVRELDAIDDQLELQAAKVAATRPQ